MAKEKQLQKRATNAFVTPNSGGIVLRGVDVGHDTTAPTFSVVIAAGGNSAVATLNSGNAALFEFIRVQFSDSVGKTGAGIYAGAAINLDITNVSKASSSTYPNVTFSVVYKLKDGVSLKDGSPVLNYNVPFDAATLAAGITFNTADRLNTNDRGMQIEMTALYTLAPDRVTINILAIAAIGLTFEAFRDVTSLGTVALAANGTGQIVSAGTLAAGTYVFKVICTTPGAAFGSFALKTVTV